MMNDEFIKVIYWNEEEIKDIYNLLENKIKFTSPYYKRISQNSNTNFILKYIIQNKNYIPLRSIFRILVRRYSSKFAIVETPYIDAEYLESFGNYYSKSFKEFDKSCYRIHFFKEHIPLKRLDGNEILREIINNKLNEYLKNNYLGFITLRPLISFNLGRSIIKFDENFIKAEDGELEGFPCSKCEFVEHLHLFNKELRINSIPFMQQNPVIGVCASTSIWVASNILQNRYRLYNIPYYKITQYATKYSLETGSPIYSEGLTVNQITSALKFTSAEIRTISASNYDEDYIKESLYNYIESNIPVIILFKQIEEKIGHSVVCIGHFLYKYDGWKKVNILLIIISRLISLLIYPLISQKISFI